MGGNIEKGKSQPSDNKKNNQLIKLKNKDLKYEANLGKERWFFTRQYLNWELYNNLSPEKKKKIFWTIFPLEISHDIERYYVNGFPYESNESNKKMIYFDKLQKKHVLLIEENNSFNHYGIVMREEPNKYLIIKNENNFSNSKQELFFLENSPNSFQYNLINNLAIICYENIFSFFKYDKVTNNLIKKFLSTTLICSQSFYNFIYSEYQEYIKFYYIKFRNSVFSLSTLKAMLLLDFSKDQLYLNYFLNDISERDFDVKILNMFLESGNFSNNIIDFSSNFSKKNISYTTFYLCLLFILLQKRNKKPNNYLWSEETNNDDSNNNDIKIIKKNNNNDCDTSENKKMIKTYMYFSPNQINKYSQNDYYYSKQILITSKNKFNNVYSLFNKNKTENYIEIEIRIPPKSYSTNMHPIFNMDEIDISDYSLYNEENIIFLPNTVFKCLFIDKSKNKIIFKFIRDVTYNPLLYISRENKKFFGIIDDGFRYLTEEQRKQVYIARVKNKEVKFIYGLDNLRELEINDDSEQKTDINILSSFFCEFKKLNSLTISGNDMSNKDCVSLSTGLKYLKELKILNLTFYCLNDNNISKLRFESYNKIEVLNLKSNYISEQSLELFKDEISKLKNLKEFNILDNNFGDQGFIHLINAFISLKELRILIVANCNISNKGLKKMYEIMALNDNYLEKLEIFNLSGNSINDECLTYLIFIIKKLNSLRKFSISQNQISFKVFNKIYDILKTEINKYWCLDPKGGWFNLVDNLIQEEKQFDLNHKYNEIPVKFDNFNIKYLRKNRNKLQNKIYFDFSNCKMIPKYYNKQIFQLEKELNNFQNIKIINFSYNYISLPAYEALCEGFKKLNNLSKLILSSNNITDKAFEYVNNIFEKCKNLNYIDMSINNITDTGFSNFCLSLTKNEIKMKEIDFYCNKIGNEGFKTFCEEAKIDTFTYLQKLNLSKNLLGNESMKNFSIVFAKFENLIDVNFSFNKFGDEIILYFNPQTLNELVDMIQIIDISNNKLSNEIKNLLKESGIPFNIIY